MTIPFRPILDRVIFIKPKAELVRESGIVIPISMDEHEEVEVVAVGPGKYGSDGKLIPMEIKVGDRVLVNKHQVQEVKLPGWDLLVCNEEHIRMVL